jgi:hypothetical protein
MEVILGSNEKNIVSINVIFSVFAAKAGNRYVFWKPHEHQAWNFDGDFQYTMTHIPIPQAFPIPFLDPFVKITHRLPPQSSVSGLMSG